MNPKMKKPSRGNGGLMKKNKANSNNSIASNGAKNQPDLDEEIRRYLISPNAPIPNLKNKSITVNPRWDIVKNYMAIVSWRLCDTYISALNFRSGFTTIDTKAYKKISFTHYNLPSLPVSLPKLKASIHREYPIFDYYNFFIVNIPRYIYLPSEADYHIIASYIILTYFSMCFDAIPYLHIYAPKGTGKTTLLRYISYFSRYASIHTKSSPPATSYMIDELRQTTLWDQAEYLATVNKDSTAAELMPYLTSSYTKDSGKRIVMDMTKKNTRSPYEADFFGPKVFASYREVYYDLSDRCIRIEMEKAPDKLVNIYEISSNVRNTITYELAWCFLKNWKTVIDTYTSIRKQNIHQNARIVELFTPIATIMKLAKVNNYNELEKAILYKISKNQEVMTPAQYLLLTTIYYLCARFNSNKISSKSILDELKKSDNDLSPRYISEQVNLFKIGSGPKTIHIQGHKTKGYEIDITKLRNTLEKMYCCQNHIKCNHFDPDAEVPHNECTLLVDICPYASTETDE